MFQFPSNCAWLPRSLPRTPLRGLQRSPDPHIGSSQNCRGGTTSASGFSSGRQRKKVENSCTTLRSPTHLNQMVDEWGDLEIYEPTDYTCMLKAIAMHNIITNNTYVRLYALRLQNTDFKGTCMTFVSMLPNLWSTVKWDRLGSATGRTSWDPNW